MKKLSFLLLATLLIVCSCSENHDEVKLETVTSFTNLLSEPETEFVATEGTTVNEHSKLTTFGDNANMLKCDHYFSDWGFGGGVTCTNKTDITTPGYINISAITAKGKNSSVYLTVNSSEFSPAIIENLNPDKQAFKGAWITNAVYAYLAIKDGQDGYLNQTQFKAGDWFKLEAVGYSADKTEIGKVEMYLADYRDGKTEILNTWKWFDWSAIANAVYIDFKMTSTDNGEYGMNTPAYFCMDAITFVEK